jgi:superfamily I DNA/RNA helicase
LFEVIPDEVRTRILEEASAWTKKDDAEAGEDQEKVPSVKITSFEGSKGLSAQYVFIVGLHSGDLPRDGEDIKDIEICRLLVALTRTKKKCAVLVTKRFGENFKQRSEFLGWVKPARFEEKKIDANYWRKKIDANYWRKK